MNDPWTDISNQVATRSATSFARLRQPARRDRIHSRYSEGVMPVSARNTR